MLSLVQAFDVLALFQQSYLRLHFILQYFILYSVIDRLQFSLRVIMFLVIRTCANVSRFACISELCEYFSFVFFSEICV